MVIVKPKGWKNLKPAKQSSSHIAMYGAEMSSLFIMPWSFWRPAPATSHLISIQKMLGDSKDFRSCVPGIQDKDQMFVFLCTAA